MKNDNEFIDLARKELSAVKAENRKGGRSRVAAPLRYIAMLRRMAVLAKEAKKPGADSEFLKKLRGIVADTEQPALERKDIGMITDDEIRDDVSTALMATGQVSPQPNWSREFCVAIARQYYGSEANQKTVDSLGACLLAYCRSLGSTEKSAAQRHYEGVHERIISMHPGDIYVAWDDLTPGEQQAQSECERIHALALNSANVGSDDALDEFATDRWIAATEFVARMWLETGNGASRSRIAESNWLARWLNNDDAPTTHLLMPRLTAIIRSVHAHVAAEIAEHETY